MPDPNTSELLAHLRQTIWIDRNCYPGRVFGIIRDRNLAPHFLNYSRIVRMDDSVSFLIDAASDGLPGDAPLWNSNRATFYYKKYFKRDATGEPAPETIALNLDGPHLSEADAAFAPIPIGMLSYARRQLSTTHSEIVARKDRQLALLRSAMVELCSLLAANGEPGKFYNSTSFQTYHQAKLNNLPPPLPMRSHGRITLASRRPVVRFGPGRHR